MSRGLPSIRLCDSLPSLAVCETRLDGARRHLQWLEAAEIERLHWRTQLEEPLRQAHHVVAFWAALTLAQDKTSWPVHRRQALRRAEELLRN